MAAAVGRMSGHWTRLKNQGTTVSFRQFSIFMAHFPKTSVQTHTNQQYRLPSMSSQHTANPFSVRQESTVATRQLHITPTIVTNYMIIHTPPSVVL